MTYHGVDFSKGRFISTAIVHVSWYLCAFCVLVQSQMNGEIIDWCWIGLLSEWEMLQMKWYVNLMPLDKADFPQGRFISTVMYLVYHEIHGCICDSYMLLSVKVEHCLACEFLYFSFYEMVFWHFQGGFSSSSINRRGSVHLTCHKTDCS